MSRTPPFGRPQVLQGNFPGRLPSFVAQARLAPHGLAANPSRMGNAFQVPPALDLGRAIQGRPLPDPVRRKMESFFKADFSDVRVHVGPHVRSLGALAFTIGSSIHFAPGQYDPATPHGQRLLGHELTHVVQQRAGRVQNPFRAGVAVVQDPGMEAEAERMGLRAAVHTEAARIQPPVPQAGRPAMPAQPPRRPAQPARVIMRKVGFEYELGSIETQKNTSWSLGNAYWVPHGKGEVLKKNVGYDITADINGKGGSQIEFILREVDENDDAARRAILRAAHDVVEDIKALTRDESEEWVPANQIPRINGSRWLRFRSSGRYDQIRGQLQMTGGIRITRLSRIVSGTAREDKDPLLIGTDTFHDYSQNYASQSLLGEDYQPIWRAALAAVENRFPGMEGRDIHILASVITVMAQVPLNARDLLPGEGQGLFQARTDYSKILRQAAEKMNRRIPFESFLHALLETLNTVSGLYFLRNDSVFPQGGQIQGQSLHQLTIAEWVRRMLPARGFLWGWWQGTDLLTERAFPGSNAQRKVLRSYGGLGSKTDPGNKLIFEWRNLMMNHPEELPVIVEGLLDYVREANA